MCPLFKINTISNNPCRLSRHFRLDVRHLKFCDRVFAQSMNLHENNIMVSLDPDNRGLVNGVRIDGYDNQNRKKKLFTFAKKQRVLTTAPLFRAVYQNKYHMTSNPVIGKQ